MTVAGPLFASTPGGVAGLPTITSQMVSILTELEINLNSIKSNNNAILRCIVFFFKNF